MREEKEKVKESDKELPAGFISEYGNNTIGKADNEKWPVCWMMAQLSWLELSMDTINKMSIERELMVKF